MADIDKKYAPIVKTDEFKEWVSGLKEELSRFTDLDLDNVSKRVLLYYYLYHKENYPNVTNGLDYSFLDMIYRGYSDILNGEHIILEDYTVKLGDYVALLRDTLKTIYMDNFEESIYEVSRRLSSLPKVETVYILDGLSQTSIYDLNDLDLSKARSIDYFYGYWPDEVPIKRLIMPIQ